MGYIDGEWYTEEGNNGKEWERHVAAYLCLLDYLIQGMRFRAFGTELDVYATSQVGTQIVVECHDSRKSMGYDRIRRLMGVHGICDARDARGATAILATTGDLTLDAGTTVTCSEVLRLRPPDIWIGLVPQGLAQYTDLPYQTIAEQDLPIQWNPSEISWLKHAGSDARGKVYKHHHTIFRGPDEL